METLGALDMLFGKSDPKSEPFVTDFDLMDCVDSTDFDLNSFVNGTDVITDLPEVKSEEPLLSSSDCGDSLLQNYISDWLPYDDLFTETVGSPTNQSECSESSSSQSESSSGFGSDEVPTTEEVSTVDASELSGQAISYDSSTGVRTVILPKNFNNIKTIRVVRGNSLLGSNYLLKNAVPNSKQVTVKGGNKTELKKVIHRISVAKDHTKSSKKKNGYPELILTDEERKLCKKEDIILPSHYPLTREEERNLKRIRRKIRNKVSAQNSRLKKKTYCEELEDRVNRCTSDNHLLQSKVEQLQQENQSLLSQLKKLQTLIKGANSSAQSSTCMLVLLMSIMLLVVPSMKPGAKDSDVPLPGGPVDQSMDIGGGSRSLLSQPVSMRPAFADLYREKHELCRDVCDRGVDGNKLQDKKSAGAFLDLDTSFGVRSGHFGFDDASAIDHDYTAPGKYVKEVLEYIQKPFTNMHLFQHAENSLLGSRHKRKLSLGSTGSDDLSDVTSVSSDDLALINSIEADYGEPPNKKRNDSVVLEVVNR